VEEFKFMDKIKCKYCKSPVVARTNSKTHTQFYGCSKFPKCKWTCDLQGKDSSDRRAARNEYYRSHRTPDNPDIIGSGCQADYGMWGFGEDDQGPF